MSILLRGVRPGCLYGQRPERQEPVDDSRTDRYLESILVAHRRHNGSFAAFKPTVTKIHTRVQGMRDMDDLTRARARRSLLEARVDAHVTAERTIEVFAHVFLECESLFALRLHDEQLYAGWSMLRGALVEMRTGEGKTVSAALPAIAIALGGMSVHVATANDYLARRDAAALCKLYRRFGLDVTSVDETLGEAARTSAYGGDVVYGAARQFVFDYLRDAKEYTPVGCGMAGPLQSLLNAAPSAPRLRGLCAVIIDEADSVLVDAARTPFVLSEAQAQESTERSRRVLALAIARSLHEGVDYRVVAERRVIELSDAGHAALHTQTQRLRGLWQRANYRAELITQALTALHLFVLDRDYLVRDGRVVLIDSTTGRAQPDHRLRQGLHRLIELKEGCELTAETDVIASISFQRFYARYHHLCGMSGTLTEVRGEMRAVYQRPTLQVPVHAPDRFRRLATTVFVDRDAQLEALRQRVLALRQAGRPVLIGTRSLALSEVVACHLEAAGIAFRLLNARQDAEEANVIVKAGQTGMVTLATNMAGRGSDIPLSDKVRVAGGLHVINLELNDSARTERQLFGRAARQGDPGSGECLYCLDDEALSRNMPSFIINALRERAVTGDSAATRLVERAVFAWAQRRIESRHAHQRMALFHQSEPELRQLAIAGE